jgi:radical SAM protein with 4Fe4S-binding SPASM domain
MLFLETNGNVYPCTNTPYKGEKFNLGNINNKSISEILGSNNYNKKIKNAGNPKICNSCDPISCRLNLLASSKSYL